MKTRTKLLTISLGAIAALNFASCQDYTEFSESEIKNDMKMNEYVNNFVNHYGSPDPDHTWGMGPINSIGFFSGATTRATDDNVEVRRNMWCDRDKNQHKYKDDALINDVKVPGWPNFDGFYYASTGADRKEIICTETDIWDSSKPNYRPVGDVTDYEIKYVSNWFRTHPNPESIDLHLSDFFIQNVSCDNDQISYDKTKYPYTGGSDGGYNGHNVERASDITGSVPQSVRDAQQDFTVGNITRKSPNYADEGMNYAVDQLQFKSIGGSSTIAGDGWTHVNNFNAGNSNFNPESKNQTLNREIMYVYSSGTEDFACRSSMGSNQPWINKWALVHLEWDEPGADGTVRHRDGYYLGFDFTCDTQDTHVDYDGYYSNWIIKITPGHFVPSSNKVNRVMCEDLGNTYDFDFNDVVYDVMNDDTHNQTVISLQAAGGTLPIWVGIEPNNYTQIYEAHSMLGAPSSKTPINVDAGLDEKVAIYRISPKVENIKDILIWVDHGNGPTPIEATANGNFGTNGSIYGNPLAEKGTNDAPMRFVVPSTVKWMKECQFIEEGYSNFKKWVQNQNWREDVTEKKWYEIPLNTDIIHNWGKEEVVTPGTKTDENDPWTIITPYTEATFEGVGDVQSLIRLRGYTLPSAIWKVLDTYENDDKQIGFTYVFKTASTSVEAIMIPVYIDSEDNKPYYVFDDGRKVEVTSATPQIFRAATQVDIEDPSGKNTFTYTFNFSKRQLKSDGTNYCDFILLYVKNAPSDLTIPNGYYHY